MDPDWIGDDEDARLVMEEFAARQVDTGPDAW